MGVGWLGCCLYWSIDPENELRMTGEDDVMT